MIRVLTSRYVDDNVLYVKLAGTSTDDKPTVGLATGSLFICTDTLTQYVFDEESGNWTETQSGGGGGGGSGVSFHICTSQEVGQDGKPSIQDPDPKVIYLVAASVSSGDLYDEYIWVNNNWERIGGARIDLSNYAPTNNPDFTGSISMGRKSGTIGGQSLAHGTDVLAGGNNSYSGGNSTQASGGNSHAEGNVTKAIGYASHSEGNGTTANGNHSHVEGKATRTSGDSAHAEGIREDNSATVVFNNVEYYYGANGKAAHSEGGDTIAEGNYSHAEGQQTFAEGDHSHTEGYQTSAVADAAHAEGQITTASGVDSHAEGYHTVASGDKSHAEGSGTTAAGADAHAEGSATNAAGDHSHAEGYNTYVSGTYAHAEGNGSQASATGAHAEGYTTHASASYSHTEGFGTSVYNSYAHAEGYKTVANGESSHVSGKYNKIDSYDSWAVWTSGTSYNVGDKVVRNGNGYICGTANSDETFDTSHWNAHIHRMNFVEIIGNGSGEDAANRSNARALDWWGNEYLQGDLYVGCDADSSGGSKVAKLTDIPDVQINGSSIVQNGVANIQYAETGIYGLLKRATTTKIKAGTDQYSAIAPCAQHDSVFFGLAKAAGADLASEQNITVGTYPATAKAAIKTMLGIIDIPTPPVSDGTYNLQVTVSSGTATYSWVAAPASASGVSF